MKTKALLVVGLCILSVIGCSAQKVKKGKGDKATKVEEVASVKEEVVEEAPIITEECLTNVSLYTESAKNKDYASALEPWLQVFENCPSANSNLYSRGQDILAYQIQNAKTAEEKAKWRDMLMLMHDKRIKYMDFIPGYNKQKYPRAYVLGQKALDYCRYFEEDELKATAYPWLKESVEGMGANSSINVLNKFAEVSNAMFKADADKYQEQYISDYQKASDLLGQIAKDASNKNAKSAQEYKDRIDALFAASGAASCDKLDELYAKTVQENAQDIDMLGKIMKLYRSVGCVESDVYFAAAEASHKLQPTAESAAGCAAMSAKKGNYKDAVAYYDQAIELAEDAQTKADYLYNNALYCYNNLNQYSTARQYARRSLEVVPDQGRCYMLIGLMYANSRPYDDAVLNKTVYWAACDKFQKAKQVDPSVAEDAQRLINTYSRFFPTTEEIFFNAGAGLQKGKSFTVGGWIGETTICR